MGRKLIENWTFIFGIFLQASVMNEKYALQNYSLTKLIVTDRPDTIGNRMFEQQLCSYSKERC